MPGEPWWVQRVARLLEPGDLSSLALGRLWRLCESLKFVRENVEPALLSQDVARFPEVARVWERFEQRETQARHALVAARNSVRGRVSSGALGPAAFRAEWQGLGFAAHSDNAGTPADDYLDGLFAAEHCAQLPLPFLGNPNIGSRARQAADFISALEPGRDDVVFDIGSGSGKLALTVSASTLSQVVGVEFYSDYVDEARSTAASLSLRNARFVASDARDVDFTPGSIFYLYHPFRGDVASTVAHALGELAREKDIHIFSAGPTCGYGEFFEREVANGALRLRERRGAFSEAMVLSSARD
ncbi:MAG: class I SAM-dependent methyltransferase [Myxococcaceae bacterium]|nr:class I SAM-dependent methyltransferase [Myxococcaceae bacterium]